LSSCFTAGGKAGGGKTGKAKEKERKRGVKPGKKNLPFEKGVKDLKVDMKTQTITVTFREDKNTTENLQKAIEKLNIEVKGIEGNNTSAKTQTGEKCEKSCCEKEGKTK